MHFRSPADVDAVEAAFLLAAVALAGIHLYLGAFAPFVAGDRASQFLVAAVVLLVGPLVYR